MSLEKRIRFPRGAFEKRHDDPARDFGVGATIVEFALIGAEGAIAWRASTGWYLPHVAERFRREHPSAFEPSGHAVEIHSPKPIEGAQEPLTDECELTGGTCYFDQGFCAGDEFMAALIAEGEAGVWRLAEEWYEAHLSSSSVAGKTAKARQK